MIELVEDETTEPTSCLIMNDALKAQYAGLQTIVQIWLDLKEEKREITKDFNERLKAMEESIEAISSNIERDKDQMRLPLEE